MGLKKKKDEEEEAVVQAPSFLTPPSGQSAEDEETFISMKDIPDLVEMVAIGDRPSQANPFFSIKSGPILMPSSLQNDGNAEVSAQKMDLSSAMNKLELKMDILSQRMPSQQPNEDSTPLISLPSQPKEEEKPKVAGSSPPLLDLITDIKDILASALDKPESKGGFVPIPNRAAMLAAKTKSAPQPPNLNNPFIALEVSSSNVSPSPIASNSSLPSSPVPLPQFNPPPTVKPPQAAPPVSSPASAPVSPPKVNHPPSVAPPPTVKPPQAAPPVSSPASAPVSPPKINPPPSVAPPPTAKPPQTAPPATPPIVNPPVAIFPLPSTPTPSPVDPFADIFANIPQAQAAPTPSIPSASIPIQSYFSSDMLAQFQINEINIEWTLPEIDQKIQEITYQRQGIQEMLDGLTEAFMNQRIALDQYSEQEGQASGYINKMNQQLQLLQELHKVKGAL